MLYAPPSKNANPILRVEFPLREKVDKNTTVMRSVRHREKAATTLRLPVPTSRKAPLL